MEFNLEDIETFFKKNDEKYWELQCGFYNELNGVIYPFGNIKNLENYVKKYSRLIILRSKSKLFVVGNDEKIINEDLYSICKDKLSDLDYGIFIFREINV